MLGLSRISPTNLSSGLGCTRVKLLLCCSYLARRETESAPTERDSALCRVCGVGGRASQPILERCFSGLVFGPFVRELQLLVT